MAKSREPSLVKITRPVYTGILLRKRLFKLLDHARKRPVVWICGPPGAGKTTLISSYIETRRLSSLWYVDSTFYQVFHEGFKVIPSGFNVIILCRNCPPDFYARMEANQLMEVIGWDDLRLTIEESVSIARLKLRRSLSKEMLQELNNKTNGWVSRAYAYHREDQERRGRY